MRLKTCRGSLFDKLKILSILYSVSGEMFVVIAQSDCGKKNRLTYFLMSNVNMPDFI